jgi:Flp pilus assembly protein TadG
MKNRRGFSQVLFDEKGTAAVEFGLVVTFLSFLFIGLADFGMGYWEDMQVSNAAVAGAEYAIANGWNQSGITTAVTSATGLGSIQATPAPTQTCGCPSATGGIATATCGSSCASGVTAGTYVKCAGALSDHPQLSRNCQPADTDCQHDGSHQLRVALIMDYPAARLPDGVSDRPAGLAEACEGTTAVETAIVLPVFLLVFLAIVEGSLLLWTQSTLQFAVEAAARCAAVNMPQAAPAACASASATESYAASETYGMTIPSSSFTFSQPSCGYQVSASYVYSFIVSEVYPTGTITLTATSCYP